MSTSEVGVMTFDDLVSRYAAAPGRTIFYGSDPLQFGELSLPGAAGPHAVVVNVHGGVWLAGYSIDHSRAQAQALAESGFAVWNIEYRRVGNEGGGWPGTFHDVARAADYLRQLATSLPLDLTRVCLMGHSAGGLLALWLAARRRLPKQSLLYCADPLKVRGVVALAPATELRELHDRAVYDGVVGRLMGGSPQEFPDRYAWTRPTRLAPLEIPQTVIVGKRDTEWGWMSAAYKEAADCAAENVQLIVVEGAGHFELIAPGCEAWNVVVTAARQMTAESAR